MQTLTKLMDRYINETINDSQKFCGCRPEDCNDYYKITKCRECLKKQLQSDDIDKR